MEYRPPWLTGETHGGQRCQPRSCNKSPQTEKTHHQVGGLWQPSKHTTGRAREGQCSSCVLDPNDNRGCVACLIRRFSTNHTQNLTVPHCDPAHVMCVCVTNNSISSWEIFAIFRKIWFRMSSGASLDELIFRSTKARRFSCFALMCLMVWPSSWHPCSCITSIFVCSSHRATLATKNSPIPC